MEGFHVFNKKKAILKTNKIKQEQEKKKYESFKRAEKLLKESHIDPNFTKPEKKKGFKSPIIKKKRRTYRKIKRNKLKTSLGELRVFQVLTKLNILFRREEEFKDCFNPSTGQPLRFDFYLSERNICIEFDGQQHFDYISTFYGKDPIKGKKKLESQQKRDQIKNEYCLLRNIKLIRIKYLDFDRIEEILKKELNNGGST